MNPTPSPSPTAKLRRAPAWRRRLPLLGAIALAALVVVGLWPRPLPVEVATVTRGPLVVTVDEEGMTRVKNRYVITAPVAGQLQRIDWKAGAVVEAGRTVLAALEPGGADFLDARSQAQAEARARAAAAARDVARAQRERAAAAKRMWETDLARVQVLRERSVVSTQELDVAQMRADIAAQEARATEFGFQVAEFELQQANALATRTAPTATGTVEPLVIAAPVSGRILRVWQESARVVPAGFPLMEIGDPTDLEARIEVLSRDSVAVQPGASVILDRWGGDEPLRARVRLVEPSGFTKISALGVEEQRVYVIADLMDPVEKRRPLGDSYRVEARIVVWEKPDAIKVAAGAVFQRNGDTRVFTVSGGRASIRSVRTGRSNGLETEIVEGLHVGEGVVVYPGDKVVDGGRVAPLTVGAR